MIESLFLDLVFFKMKVFLSCLLSSQICIRLTDVEEEGLFLTQSGPRWISEVPTV